MKKNKIGLITFHASHNCGSMLQAYAMQTVLANYGADVKIIDFATTKQEQLYATRYKNTNIKNIIKNILLIPHTKKIKETAKNYEAFKKKHFRLTDEHYSEESELSEDKLGFDKYVCGSDQIWNVDIDDASKAYFLPFVVKHPKIAYAVSFGAKNPAKYSQNSIAFYRKAIKDFDYLSTRENNGKKWIKEITGADADVVPDPTLLLNTEDYDRIQQPIALPKHFIFYYAPGYKRDLNKFVYTVAKKYDLPVIVFNPKQYYVKKLWRYGFKLAKAESPATYLYLVKHADMIITTSFHGTIFSSLYHKIFWTLKNADMFGDDDRVRTLVEKLGLEDRVIVPSLKNVEFNFLKQPNYTIYDQKLAKFKSLSEKFKRTING